VHAQFSGIALASTLYFALYCAWSANRPLLLPRVALPALVSGVMWGGASAPAARTQAPSVHGLRAALRAAHRAAHRARPPRRPPLRPPSPSLVVRLAAVADALWFVANEKLGFVVAFPIVLAGPGIVASLWSIFLLGELRGARNLLLTALVALLVVAGAACISLSKL
tara:strand:+ start:534 stop:1034 length:501 start_codon:yes stop_codon:yes gene_type:complete